MANVRIVAGTVANDGTIVAGSGFAVTHDTTGIYNVVITPAFSKLDAAVATQWAVPGVPSTLDNAVVGEPQSDRFTVYTGNDTGSLTNRGFFFIAVGEDN